MKFILFLLKLVIAIVVLAIVASFCYVIVTATIYAVKKAIQESENRESKDL